MELPPLLQETCWRRPSPLYYLSLSDHPLGWNSFLLPSVLFWVISERCGGEVSGKSIQVILLVIFWWLMVLGLLVSWSMGQSYVAQFNLKRNVLPGGRGMPRGWKPKVALPALSLQFCCFWPRFLDSLIYRNYRKSLEIYRKRLGEKFRQRLLQLQPKGEQAAGPFAHSTGGVSWSLKWHGVGADGWLRLEQWLRWSDHPVDSAVCHPPLLLSAPQKWQLGFGLLYLIVHIKPLAAHYGQLFLVSLCSVAQGDVRPGASIEVNGARSQPVSLGHITWYTGNYVHIVFFY